MFRYENPTEEDVSADFVLAIPPYTKPLRIVDADGAVYFAGVDEKEGDPYQDDQLGFYQFQVNGKEVIADIFKAI